jgi:hypothetical protein
VLGFYWRFGKSRESLEMGATVQVRRHLPRRAHDITGVRMLAGDLADADAPLTLGAFRKRRKQRPRSRPRTMVT